MASSEKDGSDLVGVWNVPMQDRVHKIEFEHGTTTGKRVIRVDGKEILHRDWMFKLVDGKKYEKFFDEQAKKLISWETRLNDVETRVVLGNQTFHTSWSYSKNLDKETMDVWVNGDKIDTAGEFVESGTETHFEIGTHVCRITATSSGKKKFDLVPSFIPSLSRIQNRCDPPALHRWALSQPCARSQKEIASPSFWEKTCNPLYLPSSFPFVSIPLFREFQLRYDSTNFIYNFSRYNKLFG
ncbi:hypothetical protein WR25_00795 [Diploscapter pachys]|uniref:Fas apoptotic inhibitory molecule 1 n=1 Tax=Diploscapter pachys TaxID=2018661 RepID=A0A2A2JKC9_9BILA|nr:hypothetical protein WR25_00795 [Diploscapter pachys]